MKKADALPKPLIVTSLAYIAPALPPGSQGPPLFRRAGGFARPGPGGGASVPWGPSQPSNWGAAGGSGSWPYPRRRCGFHAQLGVDALQVLLHGGRAGPRMSPMSRLVLPLTTQYSTSASRAVSLKLRLMASTTASSELAHHDQPVAADVPPAPPSRRRSAGAAGRSAGAAPAPPPGAAARPLAFGVRHVAAQPGQHGLRRLRPSCRSSASGARAPAASARPAGRRPRRPCAP